MSPASEPEYLTLAEAANLLGISRRALNRWVASGRIPSSSTDDGVRVLSREQLLGIIAPGGHPPGPGDGDPPGC